MRSVGVLLCVGLALLSIGCGGGHVSTFSISGQVRVDGAPAAGATVTITRWTADAAHAEATSGSAVTGADGSYVVSDLQPATYRVTPTLAGAIFDPAERIAVVGAADVSGVDFEGVVQEENLASISGTVYAPDGKTPIAGAQVSAAAAAVAGGGASLRAVETGTDGAFLLTNVPVGFVDLIVEKGTWRKVTTVTTTEGATLAAPAAATSLPAADDGAVAIAVVTGRFDRVQDLLAKLGFGTPDALGRLTLGSEQFDLYDGDGSLAVGSPTIADLLTDPARLDDYRIVILNCGCAQDLLTGDAAVAQQVRANLRAYVQGGGRLIATDWAYDFVEQSIPEGIDFEGGAGVAVTVPEPIAAAQKGKPALAVFATPLDATMAAWLGERGALTGGRVRVTGFLDSWAVMSAVGTGASEWLEGEVSWVGDEGTASGVRPLTVSLPLGVGHAVFSSFRTEESASPLMRPQEWALAYLLFELM